ncbi:hypothetical protein A9Q99_09165 [Gammaproteobacteria bacterium 45_16_T64]|nr:hypothetical protein A9Q99_09165 [Gammaproteobacteria bacterium 45_16_T64]
MYKGYTLLELLVAISIIAVLTSASYPSLIDTMNRNRVAASVNSFVGAISFARSEAIKRNDTVTMAASNSTTDDEWGDGWSVSAGGTTIRTFAALSGSTLNSTGNISTLSFNSRGFLSSSDSLSLCDQDGDGCKAISIFTTGNTRLDDSYCL